MQSAATKKKRTAKAKHEGWVVVELRLEPELDKQVDGWRRKQEDIPSKNEAIRTLVRQGLST